MREQSLLQPNQKDQRKLQPLGGMQGHQGDARVLVVIVGIADQGGMVEKLVQRLAAIARVHGRIHQFVQVLDAGQRLGRVFLLKLLDVARAVNQELQQFGGRCRIAGRAKAFDRARLPA